MQNAFGVRLNHYQTAEQTYRSYEGTATVDSTVAEFIEGIYGLDIKRTLQRIKLRKGVRPIVSRGRPTGHTVRWREDLWCRANRLHLVTRWAGRIRTGPLRVGGINLYRDSRADLDAGHMDKVDVPLNVDVIGLAASDFHPEAKPDREPTVLMLVAAATYLLHR